MHTHTQARTHARTHAHTHTHTHTHTLTVQNEILDLFNIFTLISELIK